MALVNSLVEINATLYNLNLPTQLKDRPEEEFCNFYLISWMTIFKGKSFWMTFSVKDTGYRYLIFRFFYFLFYLNTCYLDLKTNLIKIINYMKEINQHGNNYNEYLNNDKMDKIIESMASLQQADAENKLYDLQNKKLNDLNNKKVDALDKIWIILKDQNNVPTEFYSKSIIDLLFELRIESKDYVEFTMFINSSC